MTYDQAVRLLDRLKGGELFPLPAINMALEMTGDLDDSTDTLQCKYAWTPFEAVREMQRVESPRGWH